MDRSEASLLLSSLTIALHNTGMGVAALVPVGRKAALVPAAEQDEVSGWDKSVFFGGRGGDGTGQRGRAGGPVRIVRSLAAVARRSTSTHARW